MKKIIVLLIALIVIVSSISAVSAGWFDFWASDEPVNGTIVESSFSWNTSRELDASNNGDSPGGLIKLDLDSNGRIDTSDLNFTTVNDFEGILKIDISDISDSQFETLKELVDKDLGELTVYIDDDTFDEPLEFSYSLSHVSLDGKVLIVNFTDHVDPNIVNNSGEAKILSGNMTFEKGNNNPEIEIIF